VSVMARLVFLAAIVAACSSDDGDDQPNGEAGSGGSAMQPGGAGASGGNAGGGNAGGNSMAGASGNSGSGGSGSGGKAGAGTGGSGTAGSGGAMGGAGGSAGSSQFSEVGVCGKRGEGTVSETEFTGFEELYIIDEEGFGKDICVVRFEIKRVGAAPEGCDDPAGDVDCLWTHMVELSNPMMVTDEGGVCANSELGLDAAAIAKLVGSRAAYGFVSEFAGHNSVLMEYDDAKGMWDAGANASWDAATGAFKFDSRDGTCNYAKKP